MKHLLPFLFAPFLAFSQKTTVIETADITHFWEAFDNLAQARTKHDSMHVIQRDYINRATPFFKEFLKKRHFTAEEYVKLIGRYPKFWVTVRPLTENIVNRKSEIQAIFDTLDVKLPGFKRPDVCFAIGCIRTGGTTSKDLILIGSEIAASDASVDKTGMGTWHQNVIGNSGDIVSMIAHEAVHTQEHGLPFWEIFKLMKHKRLTLLNMCIMEGNADFVTQELLGMNINAFVHGYGKEHACTLHAEFLKAIRETPFEYQPWLYSGEHAKDRPADLGYYVGSEIAKGYYDASKNKRKALKKLLNRGKYKKVYKKSGYGEKACH